jgi:hypothetical protein
MSEEKDSESSTESASLRSFDKASPEPDAPPLVPQRVTWRSVLVGLALIPAAALWLIQIEYVRYSDTPTIAALFFHCVAGLALLTGLNAAVKRVFPKIAFSSVELLTIYTMVVIGSNLCGHDVLQILFTTLVWLTPHSTKENHWGDLIQPNVPHFLLPKPGIALDKLYTGDTDLYSTGYWKIWIAPLGIWMAFVVILAFTMFCIAAILRKQWDNERLTYPLQEIPLAIAHPAGELFRQPLFWIGACFAAGIQFLNLAHILWPFLPNIPLAPQYITLPDPPWNAAGSIPICYYPFAVGIAFLLPTQLTFSCWFFFLVTRMELVTTAAAGFQMTGDSFPYITQQMGGAFLGFAVFTLYAARQHLAGAFRQAVYGDGEDDSDEPLPYRFAFIGAALGTLLILGFLVMLGMRPLVALAYLVLLAGLALCVSRLRSEVGLPSIELYQRGGDDMLLRAFGGSAFTRKELSAETLLFFLNRTHRQFPMMHHFDQLRVGKRGGAEMRRYAGAILLATVAGTFCAFWALLHTLYHLGLSSAHMTGPAGWAFGNDPWNRLASWIQSPHPRDWGAVAAYAFGFAMTGLLAWLRMTFLWWPLHPAGYVVASSFALMRLWMPIFASWLLKSLILRYGGLKGYRRALPFFIGLVVGEFTAGFIRTLLDLSFSLYLPVDSGIGGL